MAIDTGGPFARAFAEIPMPGHTAVGAVSKVAGLLAVTLGTQLHAVGEIEQFAISEPQGVVIAGIVATDTAQVAVVIV